MWWKLAGVWLATAAILGILSLPIHTHAVKLDMPPGTTAANGEYIANAIFVVATISTAAIVLAVLAIPVWLSWRIIRKRKRSS